MSDKVHNISLPYLSLPISIDHTFTLDNSGRGKFDQLYGFQPDKKFYDIPEAKVKFRKFVREGTRPMKFWGNLGRVIIIVTK